MKRAVKEGTKYRPCAHQLPGSRPKAPHPGNILNRKTARGDLQTAEKRSKNAGTRAVIKQNEYRPIKKGPGNIKVIITIPHRKKGAGKVAKPGSRSIRKKEK